MFQNMVNGDSSHSNNGLHRVRAYFPMTMIDHLFQATKETGVERKTLGFLYDIGCNVEKGIIRVGIS